MLRILLVDDHEVVRLGIKALLARHPQFQVVAEAGTAEEAVQQALQHQPDVIVMDIRLPGKSGIVATEEITQKLPGTKVIMLTSFAEDEMLFDAIIAGASGYILKQIGSGELIRALEMVGRGESLLDPDVTQKLFQRLRQAERESRGSAFAAFSERELQVLALVAEGKTNKEIAEQVFLSEKTVRNYVSSILAKLNLSNRSEATAFAIKSHLDEHMKK